MSGDRLSVLDRLADDAVSGLAVVTLGVVAVVSGVDPSIAVTAIASVAGARVARSGSQ